MALHQKLASMAYLPNVKLKNYFAKALLNPILLNTLGLVQFNFSMY